MAKYDFGGGCPCGLYKECPKDCYEDRDNVAKRARTIYKVWETTRKGVPVKVTLTVEER